MHRLRPRQAAYTSQDKAAKTFKQAIDRGNVESEAARMFDAMYRWGDVDMLIEHSHRRLIQASGGEAGARAAFEKLIGEIQSSGLRIESFSVAGSKTLLSSDFTDLAVFPTRSIVRVGDSGRIANFSFEFAPARRVGPDGDRSTGRGSMRLTSGIFPDFQPTLRCRDALNRNSNESSLF